MLGLRSSRPGLGQEAMWRELKGWGCWRTGDYREPWITEAMDEGEKRFSYPLLGKQSTKPLKQSGCIAHASVRSWHTEQIACPEAYVSLSSVCIMKTLRAGGRYYVGLLKPLYNCFYGIHFLLYLQHIHFVLFFFFDSALFYLYLSCVQCPYNLKHFLFQNNFKFN